MPAGIQVFNTSGTVTVDDTSPTLAFKAKATANIPAGSGNIRLASVDFLNCDVPLFAFRPNSANRIVRLVGIDTLTPTSRRVTVMTGRVWDEGDTPPTVNSAALGVTIYHFDRPVPSASNYGLRIFDSAGNCTFDALQKPAIVKAHYDPATMFGSWTLPVGRIGAAISSLYSHFYVVDELSQAWERLRGDFISVNANVHSYLSDALFSEQLVAGGGGDLSRPAGRQAMTLIDVTGY